MNLLIIAGSTRANARSLKVAKFVQARLKKQIENVKLLDLHKERLPVYEDEKTKQWQEVGHKIDDSDGFVIVVPEWNGSAGPGIMNLLAGVTIEFAHKPAIIIGVSNGAGGAYSIAQVKAFGTKNSKLVVLPENIRVRNASKYLNSEKPNDEVDKGLHDRIDYSLKILLSYTSKLKEIRDSKIIDLGTYRSGQ